MLGFLSSSAAQLSGAPAVEEGEEAEALAEARVLLTAVVEGAVVQAEPAIWASALGLAVAVGGEEAEEPSVSASAVAWQAGPC